MLNLKLYDNEFEKSYIDHKRIIARGVVLSEDNKIMMLKIKRNDEFGNATYLETSGGGVEEGEEITEALARELDEELGVKVEIITKLGVVDDYYNIIHRNNINHYYLVKVIKRTKIHHVSDGDNLISDILYLNIEDLIKEYNIEHNDKIIKLVYNREKPIILEAKRYLEEVKK